MTVHEQVKIPAGMVSLEGRVAFVTGAGSGIGRAGAIAMAQSGAHVVVTDRDGALAVATAETIAEAGHSAKALAIDVSDAALLQEAILQTAERHGRLDILHSHAGLRAGTGPDRAAREGMATGWNLDAPAHVAAARAAIGPMREQGGGSVIITVSNSGARPGRDRTVQAATKQAAMALTRQLAADHARDNIRFNTLCPGFADAPPDAGSGGRRALACLIPDAIPMGRWGATGQISEAIVFLASDMSALVTGHALVVDGGECI